MNISQVGIDLIKKFEGCILHAYKDAVGVPTIGYGHTGGVIANQTITQAEADTLLRHDLDKFEDGVMNLVKVPINQNQFDALVSFSFNLGLGNLGNSTLLKYVNAKNFTAAAKEFAKWNKAGGEVLDGLTKRRAAEAALFSKPVPSAPKAPVKNGWIKNNQSQWNYYVNSVIQKDRWIQDKGHWYYLEGTVMKASSWVKYKEKWYHLGKSGAMDIGWIEDKGKKYFLNAKGEMVVGKQTINGKEYTFDKSGALVQ
jgi:lysozyme